MAVCECSSSAGLSRDRIQILICLVHRIGAETSSRAVADRVQHTRAAEGEVIGQGGAFP